MWACYKGRYDTVVALVNRNADVNAYGSHHVTALMWATGRGHANVAKFLVSKGAKVTIRDKVNLWSCTFCEYWYVCINFMYV